MKFLLEEYGGIILAALILTTLSFPSLEIMTKDVAEEANKIDSNTAVEDVYNQRFANLKKPKFVVKRPNTIISLNTGFDPIETPGVTAFDIDNETSAETDITSKVKVYGEVDPQKTGEYRLRYVVKNSNGIKAETKVKIVVEP